jgi:Flp pilus assembly protein TadG
LKKLFYFLLTALAYRNSKRGIIKLKSQSGSAALEFAIVSPILILLILGIFEFGVLLYNKAVITNAAREGARAGIVKDGPYGSTVLPDKIEEIVKNYCSKPDGTTRTTRLITFGGPTTPTVPPITPCPGGAYSGTDLRVTVTFHHTYLALPDFVSSLIGGTDLTAESVMRCE